MYVIAFSNCRTNEQCVKLLFKNSTQYTKHSYTIFISFHGFNFVCVFVYFIIILQYRFYYKSHIISPLKIYVNCSHLKLNHLSGKLIHNEEAKREASPYTQEYLLTLLYSLPIIRYEKKNTTNTVMHIVVWHTNSDDTSNHK